VPKLVGINHVALEVGDVEEALRWYGRIFDLELRGRLPRMAFVDMGDQFIALSEDRSQPPDAHGTSASWSTTRRRPAPRSRRRV
jgi:lactoylglutathione lyase